MPNEVSIDPLSKTYSHTYSELGDILRTAESQTSEARHLGSSRAKGFASLIVVVASVVLQSAGLFAFKRLKGAEPAEPLGVDERLVTPAEKALVGKNVGRITTNLDIVLEKRKTSAPYLAIDENVAQIRSAAEDIKSIILNDLK